MATHIIEGPTVDTVWGDVLTRRQAEAATWIAEGKTYAECGAIMGCSERTAKAHIQDAMGRLGAYSRCQLVTRLFVNGLMRTHQTGVALGLCVLILFGLATPADDQPFRLRGGRQNKITRTVRPGRRELDA